MLHPAFWHTQGGMYIGKSKNNPYAVIVLLLVLAFRLPVEISLCNFQLKDQRVIRSRFGVWETITIYLERLQDRWILETGAAQLMVSLI